MKIFCLIILCSAEMLVDLNVPWVILGHSERRALLNESSEVILMITFIKIICAYVLGFSSCIQ